jgi:hypothetical protein
MIEKVGDYFVDTSTGEKLIPETILRRQTEIVKVFDASKGGRMPKHIKLRSAREQKRLYYNQLDLQERGFLFSLLCLMDWETNLLVGDGENGEKGRPLSWSMIDQIVGVSKPFRIRVVRKLEEHRVIGYMVVGGRRVGIVINPRYALFGRQPDDALLQVFESAEDVWEEDGLDSESFAENRYYKNFRES